MVKIYECAVVLLALTTLPASQNLLAATADDVDCYRCVDAPDIAGQAVNEWKLAPDAVSTEKIQNLAITTAKLAPQAVGEWKLKSDAVSTPKIQNGAVTDSKLATSLLATINKLVADVEALQATVNAQRAILDYFEFTEIFDQSTGDYLPTVRITGANLQIVNGQGSTSDIDGTGNLIVGYNELSGEYRCSLGDHTDETSCTTAGHIWSNSHRSGSHNLVTGEGNNYSQYGGLVAGRLNTINGIHASVSGGYGNTAGALYSSVSGGLGNTASGDYSSVSGGYVSTASGAYSSVSGGYLNTASNWSSSVSGGNGRSATGLYDWVAGSLFEDW